MNILITGAHFTPAVAVIEQLKKYPDISITYVGRKYTQEGDDSSSVESQVIPTLGVKFISLITGRLQRSFTRYTILSILKIPIGFVQAFYIILKEKPDVVLSFGGYVAVPLVICSWLLSIPIIIHEQTLVSGLANKISSFFADTIAVSFKDNNEFKGKKVVLTGNPLRQEIINPNQEGFEKYEKLFQQAKRDYRPVILITGGNQGSHILNLVVENCLERLLKISCVIHQTGDSKFKDSERLSDLQNERYIVKKWINKEIGIILSKVDFVVSRAGINTLIELAFLGKPTLVIPIPYLYKDEQNQNAKYFAELGLTKILPQSKLTRDNFLQNIKDMLKNLPKLKENAARAKEVVIKDAAQRIALETILLGKADAS